MLVTRIFQFDGAHKLLNYNGKCEKLHGHTWGVHVTVEAEVGAGGIAFDFAKIKDIVQEKVLSLLDHSYINDIIEEPSAENIALWVWERLKGALPLYEVKVYESPFSFVTYRGK
jgi:6-pyruvoyltetrahydropterin/6-carboxytetrahydropterin synthase